MSAQRGRALIGALLLALLLRPYPSAAQADRDLQTIVSSGALRVAMTGFDLPGSHRRAGNAVVGPEVDLARAIATALGVELRLDTEAATYDDLVNRVADGRADIALSMLSQSYARLKLVRFSHPYLVLRHALLFDRAAVARLANGGPIEETLRAFNGRLGVSGNSAYVEFARRNFPKATIDDTARPNGNMQGLFDGKVDAIYGDEFEVKRLLKLRPALNVRYGTAVITDQTDLISVAICRSCAQLQAFIDYHLARTADGITLQRLLASAAKD
jgi:ABC-type amino acid transport substrate-binding protein